MTTDKRKQQNAKSQATFRAKKKEQLASIVCAVEGCERCSKIVKQLIKGDKE